MIGVTCADLDASFLHAGTLFMQSEAERKTTAESPELGLSLQRGQIAQSIVSNLT